MRDPIFQFVTALSWSSFHFQWTEQLSAWWTRHNPQSPRKCCPGLYRRPNYNNIVFVNSHWLLKVWNIFFLHGSIVEVFAVVEKSPNGYYSKHYEILYGRLKSAVEDNPFAETLSVVNPPSSNTSPDWSPQQRWKLLNWTSVSGNGVKVPLPLNFTQDLKFG